MVVASGGWIKNASSPVSQNNTNLNTSQSNKMTAKGILICRDNSHPFEERTLSLQNPVRIGRSVGKVRAANNNAIFDCKVLSRNHALLWYSAGKFYLQDTRSSNGTFINNERLSASGLGSTPTEVCSGDVVQFGVDVVESSKKVRHGCIIATLKLYLPDGMEAKASLNTSITDLYKLNQVVQEASRRERALYSKLGHLQKLVENTRKAANQSWKALISEDLLLSWVETVESQLAVYSKSYTEDKIRNELIKLQEEKAQYQTAAKEALQKVLQEKLDVTQRLVELETRLSETEEECQSLHNVAKYTQNELQDLSNKYAEVEKQLQETTYKLVQSEEKLREIMQNAEQEKRALQKKLEDQLRIEKCLAARLRNSRLDSVNIHKQITALRNYMQTLQDMNSKIMSDEIIGCKEEESPIDAINAILNKLNSIHADNIEVDSEINAFYNKTDQDNQLNSQDVDSNQLKIMNLDPAFTKDQLDESLNNSGNVTEYILPPASRRTLVNGNANTENNDDGNVESDTESEVTDETCSVNNDACSVASDDLSEKSVIEVTTEKNVAEKVGSTKMEVRFACDENGDQLKICYEPVDRIIEEGSETAVESVKDASFGAANVEKGDNKSDNFISESPSKAVEREKQSSRILITSLEAGEAGKFIDKSIITTAENSAESLKIGSDNTNLNIEVAKNEFRVEKVEEENLTSSIGVQIWKEEGNASKSSTNEDLASNEPITERDDERETDSYATIEDGNLNEEYTKTLKPLSKSDSVQSSLHAREYVLETLVRSLKSLKDEDDLEAQQIVRKELDELRDWLTREPNDVVVDKLKEVYYRAKNEAQRMQEVNEELVILKERYNAFAEEKAELTKRYATLKTQCGDLLNASYSVPIHYVAPIAIALIWMLLEKIF